MLTRGTRFSGDARVWFALCVLGVSQVQHGFSVATHDGLQRAD